MYTSFGCEADEEARGQASARARDPALPTARPAVAQV